MIYKTISVCLLRLPSSFSFVSFRRTKARFLDVYISTKIRFIINVISLETFVKLISLSHFLSRVPSLCLHSSSTTWTLSLALLLLGIPIPSPPALLKPSQTSISGLHYHSSIGVISSLIHKIVLICSRYLRKIKCFLICFSAATQRDLKKSKVSKLN